MNRLPLRWSTRHHIETLLADSPVRAGAHLDRHFARRARRVQEIVRLANGDLQLGGDRPLQVGWQVWCWAWPPHTL